MTGTDSVERRLCIPIVNRGARGDVSRADEHLANEIKSKCLAISFNACVIFLLRDRHAG